MRKIVIITCLSLSGLIILEQSGILNSLLLFLLVGAIPGTNYNVPSSIMLLLIACAIWFVFFRFTAIEAFYAITAKRIAKRASERKKQMPKRRFGQV